MKVLSFGFEDKRQKLTRRFCLWVSFLIVLVNPNFPTGECCNERYEDDPLMCTVYTRHRSCLAVPKNF